MSLIKTATYILPAYWASYLINGDASGLSPAEGRQVDAWLAINDNPNICDCGESYFSRTCDVPGALAGDVCEYTAIIH
jgi:uncharacterized protein DUF6926